MKIVCDELNGCDYFTIGKQYTVMETVYQDNGRRCYKILDDNGVVTHVVSEHCPHIQSHWRVIAYDPCDIVDDLSHPGQELQPEDYEVTEEEEEEFERLESLQAALTGGSVDYYKAEVLHPTSGGDRCTIEVNDFIEAFDLNFAEGNIVKAIARLAQLRKEAGKPGSFAKYEAEKQKFFADRVYVQNTGDDK